GGAPPRAPRHRHRAALGDQDHRRAGGTGRGGGMTQALDILLLKGGPSAEREVSLVSGAACALALREKGHRVTEYDMTRDVAALCRQLETSYDVVFNALHGHYGE